MLVVDRKQQVAWWHRWLGLGLSIPLAGWIVSAVIMLVVTTNAPNGLAGVYTLNTYNSVDVPLDAAPIAPQTILATLRQELGVQRLYSLRLQSRGPHLWYIAKPSPFALAMVFDARTGTRLDPLPDSLLAVVASEALAGSRAEGLESTTEYNRYYSVDRVPVVKARVVGDQPATLILSRDEGRTLRRLNGDSERFNWWYRAFHVNQLTDHLALWTSILFLSAFGVILLTVLGYLLFWWRRRPSTATSSGAPMPVLHHRRIRNWHRTLGTIAGGVLAVELAVGAYLWMSLGPLEDPFRGKSSFAQDWQAGFTTSQILDDAGTVLSRIAPHVVTAERPVQAIEWRQLQDEPVWLITTRLDEPPEVYSAATGEPRAILDPLVAATIARTEVIGEPQFTYGGTAPQLWMDLNRPVATYKFRFEDPWNSDIYVSQQTGQIIQRRPLFWRIFGPFLAVHTFAFTGNKVVDITLLLLFQLAIIGMIATGWRLHLPGKRGTTGPAVPGGTDALEASA